MQKPFQRRGGIENLVCETVMILLLGLSLGAVALGAPGQLNSSAMGPHQNPRPMLPENIDTPTQTQTDTPPLSPAANAKRQRDLSRSNYEKLKQEADQLSDLAKSLQDELSNSNAGVLSL